ncbi:LacI family DNA-binding transcriptional regulator [Sphingomonas nostoxanthinifaciens]|uniref:LacI family DNA-binding transcriptional regulator n=1 Tax=Sphingomonas nostoxanthinifaciens TaxID=2872652 RepID=UPI001CC20F18|nr:LacI family DNA-binding transcriptional regulator [Sphingomonas nostoxanthinifaciens]UAK23042.1 LacI family DNA-binding transcriptional regulator [Sphingomonas nostoxanthinifaciens]
MSRRTRDARRMPTIADVALQAGVSQMTVSRVVRGEPSVRPATRDAVTHAIKALGYTPNPAAQMLAGSRSIRIGLLYSNPSGAYLSELLVGGLDQAGQAGAQVVIVKCEPDHHEGDVVRQLLDSGVDGLLLPPPLCDSPFVRAALAEADAPAVAIATGAVADRLSSVRIDDFKAARVITDHIVTLGHRRIGFIVGNPNQSASQQRLEGYRAALEEHGLPFDPALVSQGLFTYRSGLDATEHLLDLPHRPTAIFASNDDMAAAAVAMAHRRGLDVPGDLSVCGFDDTALAVTVWPELTTVRQPIAEMSRAAVDMLIAQIRQSRAGQVVDAEHRVLDFTLVRRQSDAAPRKATAPD